MFDIYTSEEMQEIARSLIHDLSHYLAILYGNIEISMLSMQNKEVMGEHVDIFELLSEAQATHGEVKAILEQLSMGIRDGLWKLHQGDGLDE